MSRLRQMQSPEKLREAVSLGAWLWQFCIYSLAFAIFAGFGILAVQVNGQLRNVPDLAFLQHYHPVDAIEIYDKDDQLVCTVNRADNRQSVELKDVSRYMQNAVLTAEDHHFYEHRGINVFSILRALAANLTAHRVVEGGSTITQQLVKNLFFCDAQRTLVRKVSEAIVAQEIESRYSKQEILAMYLNEIYFGNGARGIEQAAQVYFGKPASALSLSESAYLAGLISAPSVNGTIEHRKAALHRQHEILDAMVGFGYVTSIQSKAAKRAKLAFALTADREEPRPFDKYPYYISHVLEIVHQSYDQNLIRRAGLRVYTNLDPAAQESAEELLSRSIKYAPRGIDEEALVSLSVKDSAVRAIVGGAGDYWRNQWNCATTPHTVGSSFKPFVYLTAFLKGSLKPASIIADAPLTVNQVTMKYMPKNFDGKFLGKITVREALAKSRNTCAVRAAQMVGIDNVVETARLAGLNTPDEQNISLALGSCAESPMDMAAAYGTLARGGVAMKPWIIRHVDDLNGHVIGESQPTPTRVFAEDPVAQLDDILKDVVTSGTGTMARLSDRPVAGKTGTADQARDLWFVGFTPDMVTAVWGGNRQNKAVADKHVTGGSVIAKVWHDYNRLYYAKVPTPPGTLIAAKPKPQEDKQEQAPRAIASVQYTGPSQEERLLYLSRQSAYYTAVHRVYAPANGFVTRSQKGITEYTWTR